MKSLKLGALALILISGAAVPGFAADAVTLTYYIDDNPTNVATAEGLKAAFEAENPDIKIEIETHPGGGEGDNLVKTRLATGEMPDVFRYNAGSLFRALNPPETMLDLSNEAFQTNVIDSFKPVVPSTERYMAFRKRPRWAAEFSTTRRSMPTLVSPCPSPGQSSWPTTRRSRPPARRLSSRPSATPGPASCSCSRTTTTCRRRCPILRKNTLPTRPSTPPRLRLSKAFSGRKRCSKLDTSTRILLLPSSMTDCAWWLPARARIIRC